MRINLEDLKKKAFIEYLNLDKYIYLRKNYLKVNLKDKKESKTFRRICNGFYDIRRNGKWQDNFYNVFEEVKNKKDVSFNYILDKISLNNVEISFASKLLAIINPKECVWDKNVVFNLKDEFWKTDLISFRKNSISIGKSKNERMTKAKKLYLILSDIEKQVLKDNQKEISKFKDFYNKEIKEYLTYFCKNKYQEEFREEDFALTEEKILDFFLWKL